MIRLCRLARMRALSAPLVRQPLVRQTVALKQPPLRFYSVPPTTHFQPGDSPPPPPPPPPPPKKKSRFARFAKIVLALVSTGLVAGACVIIHYNCTAARAILASPPEIMALLDKAEAAEREGNLPEAFKYYFETLSEAKALGLSPQSHEYTFTMSNWMRLFKRMYNQEGAKEEWIEVCKTFLDGLKNDKVPAEARDVCIQAALAAANKLADNYENNLWSIPPDVAENLTEVINVAQPEVASRWPEAADLMMVADVADVGPEEAAALIAQMDQMTHVLPMGMSIPFSPELIMARVFLSETTSDSDAENFEKNIRREQATLLISTAFGCPVDLYIGLSGYLSEKYYLWSEHLRKQESDPDRISSCLEKIEELQQGFLKTIAAMDPHLRRNRNVEIGLAISKYWFGVVALKKGELDKAKGLLLEARTQASACQSDSVVRNATAKLGEVCNMEESGKGEKGVEK